MDLGEWNIIDKANYDGNKFDRLKGVGQIMMRSVEAWLFDVAGGVVEKKEKKEKWFWLIWMMLFLLVEFF